MSKIIDFFQREIKGQPAFAFACNFLLAMAAFSLCRLFFFFVNSDYFTDVTFAHLMNMMAGGLRFDLTALLYTNSLYMVMQILPFRFRFGEVYQKVAKWLYVIPNALCIVMNCGDTAFFSFTNRRTTCTIFSEFKNEDNLLGVFANGVVDYWYITIFAVAVIYLLYRLYQSPSKTDGCSLKSWRYYAGHALVLAFFVYFTIIGIRGGFGAYTRPITLSNANEYVNKGNEAAIVLNTPFCIYRTIGKKVYKDPKYFKSIEEAAAVSSPIRQFQKSGEMNRMNVVVMILESFGKENFGFFNKHLDGGTYKGYTPFLDSLMGEGLTFKYSYSNGRKSIDGMPSVLSSIPMFIEPFILTPYSTNSISSIADVLREEGYYTAFFHSAPNGSMGFQAYAKAAGFQDYFGMTEYGNDKDFDGTWGIWDEEFLQFYARKMNEFSKPFATSIFTVSSHHPFKVPERYKDKFPKGDRPIHQCIGYSDNALRLFFKTMSQYDWFENTLFVITADHTNQISHEEYHTDANIYAVPVLFYHPGSNLKGFKEDVLAQQIDIMPSVLSYLNYGKPFFSFGDDVIYGADKDKYVINYSNQIYQLYQGDWLLQFDGVKTKALYRFKEDVMLKNNLKDSNPDVVKKMETIVKANIQQYIHRMLNDELTAKP